ncbi:EF-TU receptor [Actinidia rufa]|uniref:non-specific serine/threonine protein kinase n=1 Tax=Actinidia rufa TaxID=165716 RepID=A0A7J0FU60_9ERIC|nr:EF-TU receptor [Actinidia rufa]
MGLRILQSFVCSVPMLWCLSMLLLLYTASQRTALAATRLGGNEIDHFALLSIKAQITHDPMLITSSWNDSLHFCQWKGVLCGRRHQRVTRLNLPSYNLAGSISPAIGNLSFLRLVNLMNNSFQGEIPHEMGWLFRLRGVIPASFGNLSSLEFLSARENKLEGNIPGSIANASRLEILDLQHNKFSPGVAVDFGNLKNLSKLFLSTSGLGTGDVNDLDFISTLVNCSELVELYIGNNGFGGVLPNSIANLSTQLQHLIVGGNQISGNIPTDIGNLVSLNTLHMINNKLTGSIPTSIGKLHKFQLVAFARNKLSGEIPSSIGNLTLLTKLWLGENILQGNIPSSLGNCKGEVPVHGVFKNASVVSVSRNNKLCGGIPTFKLPKCPLDEPRKKKIKMRKQPSLASSLMNFPRKISYEKLLKATNGFSSANLIATGNFGSLYKGILHPSDQKAIAVKVLHQQSREAIKSFMAECRALRNTRHRNVIKIAVFPPIGDDQEQPRSLSFLQRLNIAIDVAFALDYLHNHCHIPVVHCDIKPSNILLDGDMTAHVGNFGIARLLQQHDIREISDGQTSSVCLRGSIGYIAPEYGMGAAVSTSGDMYSYGVLLLEMFTEKIPIDGMFKNGQNLHKYTKMALSENMIEIVDQKQLEEEEGTRTNSRTPMTMEKIHECLFLILRIGIACSEESPRDRMTVVEVSREFFLIKDKLLMRRT